MRRGGSGDPIVRGTLKDVLGIDSRRGIYVNKLEAANTSRPVTVDWRSFVDRVGGLIAARRLIIGLGHEVL